MQFDMGMIGQKHETKLCDFPDWDVMKERLEVYLREASWVWPDVLVWQRICGDFGGISPVNFKPSSGCTPRRSSSWTLDAKAVNMTVSNFAHACARRVTNDIASTLSFCGLFEKLEYSNDHPTGM